MSAHFSKFGLNTYNWTSYFESQVPEDYPLSLVLQKCRAFRRLPPRLRELSELAKVWARRTYPPSDLSDINKWYDDEGYELNPSTGERLTDEDVDTEWPGDPGLKDFGATDIPLPPDGFADPDTWEPPLPEVDDYAPPHERPTERSLLRDIASHGRAYVARDHGVSADAAESDAALARAILADTGRGKGPGGGQFVKKDRYAYSGAPLNFPGWKLLGQYESDVGSWLLEHDGDAALLEVPEGLTVADVKRAVGDKNLKYITASHEHWDHLDRAVWEKLRRAFPDAEIIHPKDVDGDRKLDLGGEELWLVKAPKHSPVDVVAVFRGTAMTGDIELGTLDSVNEEVPAATKRGSMDFLATFEGRTGHKVANVVSAHLNDVRTNVNWPELFKYDE